MAPFEPVTEATWREAVVTHLQGKSFEKTLVGTSADGAPIQPLYSSGPARPAALASPRPRWLVGATCDASDLDATLTSAKEQGVEALLYRGAAPSAASPSGAAPTDANLPVFVDAGEASLAVAAALTKRGLSRVSALFDPFAAALTRGGGSLSLDAALAQGVVALEGAADGTYPIAVSPQLVLEGGGSEAQAIGFALAATAAWLRAADAGPGRARAAKHLGVITATLGDVFHGIALQRALRLALGKLLAACELGDVSPLLVGRSAARLRAGVDRPSNMLRSTNEAIALIVGGVDAVFVTPFTLDGVPAELGRRLAKNLLLVLREESHLGRVHDAAGGSYYVESHSDALARAGWEELARIEGEGGLARSLEAGAFQARVAAVAETRARDVARRKSVLVGVNDFAGADLGPALAAPESGDPEAPAHAITPLALERDAAPFEALRRRAALVGERGHPPTCLLLAFGDGADWRAREGFTRRLAEVGGFAVELVTLGAPPAEGAGAGSFDAIARAASEAVVARRPDVAVLCSSDARYADGAAAIVTACRAGSPVHLALAGRPGDLEAPLRAAGLDSAVYVGVDAVIVLSAWLDAAQGGAQ